MWDCKEIREILEYECTISMICWWAQELLGYNFSIINHPARMMVDVAELSWKFGHTLAQYLCTAVLLHKVDVAKRPDASIRNMAAVPEVINVNPTVAMQSHMILILTTSTVTLYPPPFIHQSPVALGTLNKSINTLSHDYVCSVLILLCYDPPISCLYY